MTDFGNPEERAAALRVALAAKELNSAVNDASALRLTVEIDILHTDQIGRPRNPLIQVGIERRTMILPTALEEG